MLNNKGNATGIGKYEKIPIIINETLTLTAITNSSFNYTIDVTGTLPINIEISKPVNYNGTLEFLNANTLNGESYSIGIYNIKIKAINMFGFDTKTLVLNIHEPIKITNKNLDIYSNVGSQFSYTINSSGLPPKNYYISSLPGIYLQHNIIRGVFTTIGVYNTAITVSNGVESDVKTLTINVGSSPNITSSSIVYGKINEIFNYQITSTGSDSQYKINGILPKGLTFKNNNISGTPTESCKKELEIKAINAFGESIKKLTIVIYK